MRFKNADSISQIALGCCLCALIFLVVMDAAFTDAVQMTAIITVCVLIAAVMIWRGKHAGSARKGVIRPLKWFGWDASIIIMIMVPGLVVFLFYESQEINGYQYSNTAYLVDDGDQKVIDLARDAMKDNKVSRREANKILAVYWQNKTSAKVTSKDVDQGVGREMLRRAIARRTI